MRYQWAFVICWSSLPVCVAVGWVHALVALLVFVTFVGGQFALAIRAMVGKGPPGLLTPGARLRPTGR